MLEHGGLWSRARQSARAYQALLLALCAACHPSTSRFPWSDSAAELGASGAAPAGAHSDVRTLNAGYARTRSHVLVREIDRPTRAALDYAAYHANFMIAGEPPANPPPPPEVADVTRPFEGLIERGSLTPDIGATPLTAAERARPLAFAPLSEYLLSRSVPGADALAELAAAVHGESWGGRSLPGVPAQSISELYLHDAGGAVPELWVKVEFTPWFLAQGALGSLPDQDRDGYPEVYGRAAPDRMNAELAAAIEGDYAARELSAAEVRTWANELSSYWYPSFNTDLVKPGASWPDAQTEPEIKRELRGLSVRAPAVVLRGKPLGQPTYDVFVVKGLDAAAQQPTTARAASLDKHEPTPRPQPVAEQVRRELTASGATSWLGWSEQLAPFKAVAHKQLEGSPKAVKGIPGLDGFLFYRTALEYSVGGDLEQQPAGKNPLPVIVEWQRELQRLGVDFLFVPVPAKVEIFPDKLDATLAPLVGHVVNPWERKLVASLAAQGVEVLDLLSPLTAARAPDERRAQEPLYQRQDTHWSARGLELAARLIAARIQRYPWYTQLAQHKQKYTTRETSFTRFGDLHSRLPERQQKQYHPETLRAHQVLCADGSAYEDDPESPIVVLGDSFTGVYELTDAEHAGVSAHIARELGVPVDLVMSYGGGPNVRNKLMRRGEDALARKQLVVWIMADRDLYNYWEDWEPLRKP